MNLTLGFPEPSGPELIRKPSGLEGALTHFREWMAENPNSPVRSIRHEPARAGEFAIIPERVAPAIRGALERRGVAQLYSHQAESFEHVEAGKNVVVVTPTASGKTLCYNLPVFNKLLAEPATRALYLFPTKALRGPAQRIPRHGGIHRRRYPRLHLRWR